MSFLDLHIDAVDPELLGRFWTSTLGWAPAMNVVSEPVTAKQRVHLDVHAAGVDDVLALGATPEDVTSFHWKVLRDPEGGELCVFEREAVPENRLYEVVVDCADPGAQAEWWGAVLGGRWEYDEERDLGCVVGIPGAPFEYLVFVPVPEPKTVKNRIHWHVRADVAELVSRGASVLWEGDGWTVLADPEGNEFCAE